MAQIERLWKQSNGGFGAYLLLAHNWANPKATLRSYGTDRARGDAAVPGPRAGDA